MKGINRAIIVGTLGQDPEVKYGSNGGAIVNLSVATNESWKDKQGQKQERTEWHRVSIFGKLAEIAAQYLKKGSQVYLEGRIQTRKWQGQDGQDRYTTEIIANEMQMLGSSGGAGSGNGRNSHGDAGHQSPQPSPNQQDVGFDDVPFIDPYKFIRLFV